MSAIALGASIGLGAAFVLAGGSKLAAGRAWPAQAAALGAPAMTIPAVPWFELIIGAALICQLVEPFPAAVALVMLAAFTVMISVKLAQGQHPACACFGAWSARPIGPWHLLRNAVLGMLGVLAIIG